MKNKKLMVIGSIFIILLSIIAIIFILTNNEEEEEFKIDGIDLVENKEVLKDTTVKELKITDASLYIIEGRTKYSATITNTKDTEINITNLYVTFHVGDIENKILALSDVTLKADEDTIINITSENDYSKITKITYSIE